MFSHRTQIADAKRISKMLEKLPKEEYFLQIEK